MFVSSYGISWTDEHGSFDRRFRIYDISDYGETITTYKRTEHDVIVDREVLAGHGAPARYEGT
jgi:hypothetical protein